jgi:hypothetical protein
LESLKMETFRHLDEHGDPDSPEADPKVNTRRRIIARLRAYMEKPNKEGDYGPGRETLRPHVEDWIERWRRARNMMLGASFEPDALKVITQAFDEAWGSIADNYKSAEQVEAARIRLANAMLSVASDGSRDVEILKHAALRVMEATTPADAKTTVPQSPTIVAQVRRPAGPDQRADTDPLRSTDS